MAWRLAGEYLENCNCDILCPCITSSLQGPADNERCYVPLAAHVREGDSDGVRLDGLSFVLVVDSPQVMGQGGWRVAIYVDERADERQRQALGEILSGAKGGPPAMLAGLVGEQLGVKMEIANVFHPMGANLPIARGVKGTYSDPDYGLSFDNTGKKNGHYREFAWQG